MSLRHVTLYYGSGPGAVTALDDVTLRVRSGERICILGANGSGKSTLASVICGLLAPDEGEVVLAGERAMGPNGADLNAYRRARRRIGLVFQNPEDQIVTSIVEEDVAFGPENLGLPSEEIGIRVARELGRVAMSGYARSDPARLSGGQRQLVAIAGAMAMEPRVLVLDEPGALLDVRGRCGIMRVMEQLKEAGTTVIHITHFVDEGLAADRVIVMDCGRVVLDGAPEQVFSQGDELAARGLELPFTARLARALRERDACVPWTCDEGELRAALAPLAARAAAAGGGSRAPATSHCGDAAARVDRVSYSYHGADGRRALEDVSFDVARGASVALIGQTGSGKSTLVRLLCALEAPDRGRIVVNGIDTSGKRDRRRLHGAVGYVMQHPERQLFAETVLEDVAYGPANRGLSDDEVQERCARALKLVGLEGREDASPFRLSGGQQRLCAIAGVLAMQPGILVLDEPTAGLDPRGREQIERILDDIRRSGTTIVRVTHSIDAAARAEQVIVLSEARVLMRGTPEEVFAPAYENVLRDTGLGLPTALRWAMALGLQAEPLTMEALVDCLVGEAV